MRTPEAPCRLPQLARQARAAPRPPLGRRSLVTGQQPWMSSTYDRLADLLDQGPAQAWDAPSLCQKWLVRQVIAHVTVPVRLTPQTSGAETAAAGRDFGVLSDTMAARDAELPAADLLGQLRSPQLHAWQPLG